MVLYKLINLKLLFRKLISYSDYTCVKNVLKTFGSFLKLWARTSDNL